VALFRADNTAIALGQALEAGITVTLVETLTGFTRAVNAVDYALIVQLQVPPQVLVEGHADLAQQHLVLYGVRQAGFHLAHVTRAQ
jgi:hypothetical protein